MTNTQVNLTASSALDSLEQFGSFRLRFLLWGREIFIDRLVALFLWVKHIFLPPAHHWTLESMFIQHPGSTLERAQCLLTPPIYRLQPTPLHTASTSSCVSISGGNVLKFLFPLIDGLSLALEYISLSFDCLHLGSCIWVWGCWHTWIVGLVVVPTVTCHGWKWMFVPDLIIIICNLQHLLV